MSQQVNPNKAFFDHIRAASSGELKYWEKLVRAYMSELHDIRSKATTPATYDPTDRELCNIAWEAQAIESELDTRYKLQLIETRY